MEIKTPTPPPVNAKEKLTSFNPSENQFNFEKLVEPGQGAPQDDPTKQFQEKLTALQGKPDEILKLKEEVQQAVKDGKKISPEFLKQFEEETPEQKKIKELTVKKTEIENNLKLSEEEKKKAIVELEEVKKPEPKYWEKENLGIDEVLKNEHEQVEEPSNEEYLQKSLQYDEILKDPFITAYLTNKEAGKTSIDFISELSKENPKNISDDALLEMRIKRNGLTDEEAEEERDRYKELSPIQKRNLLGEERGRLNEQYQKTLEKFSANTTAEKEKIQNIAIQAVKEHENYIANLKDKQVAGILYDSTQLQKLSDWAQDAMLNGLMRKDGSWDVPRIMQLGMLALNKNHMLQKAYEKGKTEAQEDFFKEYGRPSKTNGIARTPETSVLNKKEQFEQESKDFVKQFQH